MNNLLLQNYKNYLNNQRDIESSLIGSNTNLYQRIQKIVRFWGTVCNYSFPKFQLQKLNLQTRNLHFKNFRKSISQSNIKLPKLYTNSSIVRRNDLENSDYENFNKNVFDILIKNEKNIVF